MSDSLQRVRTTASNWLVDNIHQFDPMRSDIPETVKTRRKALGELAHCALVQSYYDDTPSEIQELIFTRANDPDYFGRLLSHPQHLSQIAPVLVYAAEMERLDGDARKALVTAFNQRISWAIEVPAYEYLEQLRLSRLIPDVPHHGDPESAIECSFLSHPPNVVTAELFDAYKLTHDIFFNTDYGRDGFDFPLSSIEPNFRGSIKGLLLKYLYLENSDIVIELLAAGVIKQTLPDHLISIVSDWLASQCGDRRIDAPKIGEYSNTPSKESDFEHLGSDFRRWGRHYHVNTIAASLPAIIESYTQSNNSDMKYTSRHRSYVFELGEVINHLAEYKLGSAVNDLKALSTDSTTDDYTKVIGQCVSFLDSQKAASGTRNVIERADGRNSQPR